MSERARGEELHLLEMAGEIRGLVYQPRYPLLVKDIKVGTYVGDFEYHEGDNLVVEEVKGFRTALYKLKRKMMKAIYGIAIREIEA